jgi:hypothetical protein
MRNNESFVLRQTHFSVNTDMLQQGNVLRPGAVRWFQKVNNCLNMANLGRNM